MIRIFKTILGVVFTIFIVLTIVFFMVRLAPGSPFDAEKALSSEVRAQLNKTYGLDKPLFAQYQNFLWEIAHGNLGISITLDGQSVSSLIARAFPVSLCLGLGALLLAVGFGIPLGFWWSSARSKNVLVTGKWLYIFSVLPSFVAAPLMQQAVLAGGGVAYGDSGPQSFFWPAVSLGLYYLPFVARLAQVGFQSESQALYLRAAQAKGLSRLGALWKHGAKAALSPVFAYLGPTAAGLVTGSFVVETVWGLPGLGRFFVNSVFNRDDPLLLGLVAFYSLILIFLNALIELLLMKWNPSGKRKMPA